MKKLISALLALIFSAGMLTGCIGPTKVYTELSHAESYWWAGKPSDYCVSFMGFALMPDRSSNAKIEEYYFRVQPTLLDDTIQLYLNCVYSEEDYAAEVERLKNLDCIGHFPGDEGPAETSYTDGGAVIEEYANGTRYYDDGTFNYPAYVQGLEWGRVCEYALLMEQEHRIVYVYLQYEYRSRIKFDKAYLPNGGGTGAYAP